MSVWFDGANEIACDLDAVTRALEDPGALYVGVTALMPGMTSVELVEQGDGFVTIETNEGLMRRTGVTAETTSQRVVVAYDEEYRAGGRITTRSHVVDEFDASDAGVTHRLVISGVQASGLLGFFYRTLGSSNTGKAFLAAYKTYFEQPSV